MSFLKQSGRIYDSRRINEDDNYIEFFSLDSLDFITLISLIEKEFQFKVDFIDLTMDKLNTIEKIYRYFYLKKFT